MEQHNCGLACLLLKSRQPRLEGTDDEIAKAISPTDTLLTTGHPAPSRLKPVNLDQVLLCNSSLIQGK